MASMIGPHHQSHDTLTLKDGSQCRIRPSGPKDRKRLADCFKSLSPRSRQLRFFFPKQALLDTELDFYADADGHDHIALAAIQLDHQGRELHALGFARCIRLPSDKQRAEMSIIVIDKAQGQGIGGALLTRLIDAARAQGIRQFVCEVLAENAGMRNLASQLGGDVHWLGDGTVEYDCALPTPSVDQSHWSLPWFADPQAWISACADAWLAGLDGGIAALQSANENMDHWYQDSGQALAQEHRMV